VVYCCSEFVTHRDTENTEVAQRRAPFGLLRAKLASNVAIAKAVAFNIQSSDLILKPAPQRISKSKKYSE
jgi:hypothetical protein